MKQRILVLPPEGDDGTAYAAAKNAMRDGEVFGITVELLWAEDDSGYLMVEIPTAALMKLLLTEAATRGYRVGVRTKHAGKATYRELFAADPMLFAQGMAAMADALIEAGHATRAQVVTAVEGHFGES